MKNSPIIVALDFETAAEAKSLVAALDNVVSFYKIGLELFTSAGPDFVRELKAQGHRVFLDLKMYDIGETVKRAVARVARLGVDFLTIHATVGVMQSAVAGCQGSELKLLAVTVLTSVDDHDLLRDGYSCKVADLVELRVRNAMEAGIGGIVCSALEVARVRAITGLGSTLVIPGTRSAGAAVGDQKRVATPSQALTDGADYLVMGRQVTRSRDPRREITGVLEEIQSL